MKKKTSASLENTKLISFKISHDLYKQLEKLAAAELDEAGLSLSPSLLARRLMLEALRRRR